MKRDCKLFLEDIISAIEAIESFVDGLNMDDLIKDDRTSSAVIRKLEIIGEATKNIPENIRKKDLTVPWTRMA